MIVQHLDKFSPTAIKELQCVSLIRWDLIHNGRTVTTLEVPKGEVTYFDCKAQHEVMATPEFVKALLAPIKTYFNSEKMKALVSVRASTMMLEINRMPFVGAPDSINETLKVIKPSIVEIAQEIKLDVTLIDKLICQWRNIVHTEWQCTSSTVEFWAEVIDYKDACWE
ncbi:hypothetical protein ACJJTC_010417 [Scirpophaga incertulas]